MSRKSRLRNDASLPQHLSLHHIIISKHDSLMFRHFSFPRQSFDDPLNSFSLQRMRSYSQPRRHQTRRTRARRGLK